MTILRLGLYNNSHIHLIILPIINLDPNVAERPKELIVYGGNGKAAPNPEALARIFRTLQDL
jgi:urocanate hydratase